MKNTLKISFTDNEDAVFRVNGNYFESEVLDELIMQVVDYFKETSNENPREVESFTYTTTGTNGKFVVHPANKQLLVSEYMETNPLDSDTVNNLTNMVINVREVFYGFSENHTVHPE